MLEIGTQVDAVEISGAEQLAETLASANGPMVFRGLVSAWPLVQKSQISDQEVDRYLRQFYPGVPVQAFVGDADIGNRFSYNDDINATNFTQIQTQLDWILDQIQQHADDLQPPTFYMGSTTLNYCLPGLSEQNHLALGSIEPVVRVWIGNQTRVAAHYDVPDNIACVCSGRRRFIFFPPDQLDNLYVGPLDLTPAGQPISLVDFENPDFDKYPRFADALATAQVAELEPGDAVFIPSMWWHHVEGLDKLNILINYWWRQGPNHMGLPTDALLHAIMNIRDLPLAQRSAWRHMFDHYVFNPQEHVTDHIPEAQRGVLGQMDENTVRKLLGTLRNSLNR